METIQRWVAAHAELVPPGAGDWSLFVAFWGLLLSLALAEVRRPFFSAAVSNERRIVANLLLGGTGWLLILVIPFSAIATAAVARDAGFGVLNILRTDEGAAFAITLLARSLAGYWLHRLSHSVSWLWRVHRVHHCDAVLDVTTAFRSHPLEVLVALTWVVGTTAALGLSPAALLVYEAAHSLVNVWSHANIRTPAWVQRWVGPLFVTPAFHHLHHSDDQRLTDSNYGELLTIWDWLFRTGTSLTAEQRERMRIGLGAEFDACAANTFALLRLPFMNCARRAGSATAGRGSRSKRPNNRDPNSPSA